MASALDTWLKLLGGGLVVSWLCAGMVAYVWKDDRKRISNLEKNKAEREDVDVYHSDHKNDMREIRDDIKDVRNLIITLMGGKRE